MDFGNRQTDVEGIISLDPQINVAFCFSKGGPGNADKPFVWLKLEAIKNFEDPATVRSLTPLLYSFMKDELKLEKVIDNCKILITKKIMNLC